MTTILVVDDEPAMVGMVGALLGEDGYQIVTAYDGETALKRHADEHPDLVILDRRLPRMSGDEVCREIRKGSNTPILMLTGEKGTEEHARLLDIGADDYLEKPFGKKELSARVRALLRRAPSAAQGAAARWLARRARPGSGVAQGTSGAAALEAGRVGHSGPRECARCGLSPRRRLSEAPRARPPTRTADPPRSPAR